MEHREYNCPAAGKCGACTLLGMDYPAQLEHKQRRIQELLGGFCRREPILGCENPLHYRNKVHAAAAPSRSGMAFGTYAARSHRLVDSRGCLLEDRHCRAALDAIEDVLRSFKLRAYNEDARTGLVRHILLRRGVETGEMMAVLVLSSPVLPSSNAIARAIRERVPALTTLITDVNARSTSAVLGGNFKTLYGPGYIRDRLCGLEFRISPGAFYQVNHAQTERLYALARDAAALTGRETLIDAYCGVGTIGLTMAKSCRSVLGIELSGGAVHDARVNARINGITNALFVRADAAEQLSLMASRGERADVLVMDPPRAGSTERFLRAAAKMSPGRIVYISCSPETLARDLTLLSKLGFAVKYIRPVDMFPMTEHVETVVLLSKLNAKQHIEVELNLDELDLTAAEKRATYDEIKAYVLEKYGLKVSSLYISQIKRKCGLDVGQNYNLSKKEDAKVPQCPPEKEAAITEAFKFFGMI